MKSAHLKSLEGNQQNKRSNFCREDATRTKDEVWGLDRFSAVNSAKNNVEKYKSREKQGEEQGPSGR